MSAANEGSCPSACWVDVNERKPKIGQLCWIMVRAGKVELGQITDATNGSHISTRPGRVDRILTFGSLDVPGRQKMVERIFKGFDPSVWNHLVKNSVNDTGAQFQERCCKLALKLFWEGK